MYKLNKRYIYHNNIYHNYNYIYNSLYICIMNSYGNAVMHGGRPLEGGIPRCWAEAQVLHGGMPLEGGIPHCWAEGHVMHGGRPLEGGIP